MDSEWGRKRTNEAVENWCGKGYKVEVRKEEGGWLYIWVFLKDREELAYFLKTVRDRS